MSHYYTNDPTLQSNEFVFDYTYVDNNNKPINLSFHSDNGVFSKERVDYGTHLLLQSMQILKDKLSIDSILDVGCGIGIIGICLSCIFPNSHIDMIDVNERAINLSNKNIFANKRSNVNALISDLYQNINDNYDLIISNPPIRAGKKVVQGIVIDGIKKIKDNGSLIVVIQKKQGAQSMMVLMQEVFGNVEVILKKNGYYVFRSIKK